MEEREFCLAYGFTALLPGANPDAFGQIQDENLSIPDVPRARTLDDRIGSGFNKIFVDRDFDTDLL